MDNLMGAKELYDVTLKATYDIEIGDKHFKEGEVIAAFDNISLANFNEIKTYVSANGGYDNRRQVIWENTKEITLQFSSGVFSKMQLALLSNANLISTTNNPIEVPKREIVETDENGYFELINSPISTKPMFVYDEETGAKVSWSKSQNKYKTNFSFKTLIVDYIYNYTKGATTMVVGQQLISGYLSFEGKTRLKDDKTGHEVTGIIRIPRLKLMSELSMRLGRDATPFVTNLSAIGLPVGAKGSKKVLELIYLSDDIDSDM